AVPKLFMAGGASFPVEVIGVPLSGGVSSLAPPAHYVLFHQGGHWDYLPPGRTGCEQGMRGSCTWAGPGAADMVACFLTRSLRPEGAPFVSIGPFDFFRIDRSLRPPRFWRLLLEDDQEFFAGGHMIAWDLVDGREACAL